MADVTPQSPPLNGDESLQGVVIAFIVWSAVLPIIFVALRIIVRTRIIKIRLWWDDYFIIAAAVWTVHALPCKPPLIVILVLYCRGHGA